MTGDVQGHPSPRVAPESKVRILRVIYDLQVGGVQRQLLRLLPLLRDYGYDPHICCLKEEGEMAPQFREASIPIHGIPFSSRLDPVGLYKLYRLIHKLDIRVVHSHMYASNIAATWAGSFPPRVAVVNGYHSQSPFHNEGQAVRAQKSANRSSAVVAVSESVKAPLLKADIPEIKIQVLFNGINVPEAAKPLAEREKGAPLRLVWAGRFVKQKRIDMIVDVAEAVREAGVPFKLVLVGDGPRMERIRRRVTNAKLEGLVEFTGWQADIRPFVADADLYVSTSNREGLPNTLLEVLAQGRGCLVADIPPNREVLADSGAGHLLGDNLGGWVAAMSKISESPDMLSQMSEAAFRRVQTFSIENTARQTHELYQSILSE